jgi:agmatine/peptidylarginine deiminase
MQSEDGFVENHTDEAARSNVEKTLIVLSAPSIKNKYYKKKFNDIIDYMADFANLVNGKDEVVILVDADTLPYLKEKVPSNILIDADIEDIWIRDFSPVIPSRQVKFKYLPDYEEAWAAKHIENSFKNWCSKSRVEYHAESRIILEGGNVVDNAAGTRVIVTDRILWDNPTMKKNYAKEKLKELLGVNEVAIIPEQKNDTTGHSDGYVMWPTDDKIMLLKTSEPKHTKIVNELKNSFPNVEIVEVPNYIPTTRWDHFDSARNCYVNCIVTDDYIYMPLFNDPHDTEMLEFLKSHTNKTVVPILAEKIAMMGGSVRCLSWQIKNANKAKILELLKQ